MDLSCFMRKLRTPFLANDFLFLDALASLDVALVCMSVCLFDI